MRYKIVPVGSSSFHVIDTTVPGGETVAHHSSRQRAEEAIEALRGGQRLGPRLVADDEVDEDAEALEALRATLKGRVGEVQRRVSQSSDADALRAMRRLEAEGLGRRTVLAAIDQRLSSVA